MSIQAYGGFVPDQPSAATSSDADQRERNSREAEPQRPAAPIGGAGLGLTLAELIAMWAEDA